MQAPFAQQRRRGHSTGEPRLPEQLGGAQAARGRGTGAREQAEEGGDLGVPAAANLKPKDDQVAPPAVVELGIGLPALAPGSCAHSKAWLGICAGVWQRTAAHACDERALEMHPSALTPASRALLLSQAAPCT